MLPDGAQNLQIAVGEPEGDRLHCTSEAWAAQGFGDRNLGHAGDINFGPAMEHAQKYVRNKL
jgi:hypothetical protein